jgi:hypothetical protein
MFEQKESPAVPAGLEGEANTRSASVTGFHYDAAAMLRDVHARLVWALETHEPYERDTALEDLERDLAGFLEGTVP